MTAKKFTKIIFFIITLFVFYNLIIWNFYTKKLLNHSDKNVTSGDLSRMGYLSQYSFERKNEFTLNNLHLNHNYDKKKDIDILTIGDSFSNGGANGLNKYYQDYLSTQCNCNVLNINKLKNTNNYIESIFYLLHSGFLKNKNIKYIIVESTERKVIERFSGDNSFEKSLLKLDINRYIPNVTINDYLPQISFINNGNFKYLFYKLGYLISSNAFISKVYVEKLDKKYFSHKRGNKLLFYYRDISSVKNSTDENIKKVNDNFNLLSQKLSTQNIKLIFMPVVNKLNLYYEKIENKDSYPKSQFFEKLRKLKKDYIFIDTKKILKSYLDKEKDLFYLDDTHWSYKSSEIISKEILKELNALQ